MLSSNITFGSLMSFEPQTLVFENVPGMLSLAGGQIFERVLKELENLGYQLSAKILFAGHYGVPQERWRLIILGSRGEAAPQHPEPTHYAVGRANFKGGKTMTFRLAPLDKMRLKPAATVADAISDLPQLSMGEGGDTIRYDRKANVRICATDAEWRQGNLQSCCRDTCSSKCGAA